MALLLVTVSFTLKDSPGRQGDVKPAIITILALMVILAEEELRIGYLWWINNQGVGDARVPKSVMRRSSSSWNAACPIGLRPPA